MKELTPFGWLLTGCGIFLAVTVITYVVTVKPWRKPRPISEHTDDHWYRRQNGAGGGSFR